LKLSAPVPTESAEQQTVIRWWLVNCDAYKLPERVLMASPGQAARTMRNGRRMKAEGYRAGTPDLFLAVPRKGVPGLFIEMKKRDGRLNDLSDEQREMLFDLGQQGYRVGVACGAEQAVKIITEYLAA
jgi:hypothetical protein